MYNFSTFIKYKANGKIYTSYEKENTFCKIITSVEDEKITASVIPTTEIELIEFKLDTKIPYKKGDLFFSRLGVYRPQSGFHLLPILQTKDDQNFSRICRFLGTDRQAFPPKHSGKEGQLLQIDLRLSHGDVLRSHSYGCGTAPVLQSPRCSLG